MSKYVNLEDPEVHYTHNYGPAEVYIVPPEVERIDLVRCGECKWHEGTKCYRWNSTIYTMSDDFCSNGERRADE